MSTLTPLVVLVGLGILGYLSNKEREEFAAKEADQNTVAKGVYERLKAEDNWDALDPAIQLDRLTKELKDTHGIQLTLKNQAEFRKIIYNAAIASR